MPTSALSPGYDWADVGIGPYEGLLFLRTFFYSFCFTDLYIGVSYKPNNAKNYKSKNNSGNYSNDTMLTRQSRRVIAETSADYYTDTPKTVANKIPHIDTAFHSQWQIT